MHDSVPRQELFLPIHGHVRLYPEELAVVDHPTFQRLRRVRQLGMAHMVFPGGTHTRLEHSIGAVHVAKVIVDHTNAAFANSRENGSAEWKLVTIDEPTARFIRLGGLLHDIGHIPLGHTLEDELSHLSSHDGPARLNRVASIRYPEHDVDASVLPRTAKPQGGWDLHDLINALYGSFAHKLSSTHDAFTILSHIVCKPPKTGAEGGREWSTVDEELGQSMMLQVCRDIVGNTICADFLDYLYRDWHHLGKPLYQDKRLYQYMEVRQPAGDNAINASRFVINVGPSDKIRHDALTDILELLNARYKLAATVLFHRTKLALTGLLDRCLLEIADLYRAAGFEKSYFDETAERLLLEGSDDSVPVILRELAAGGSSDGKMKLDALLKQERQKVQAAAVATSRDPGPLLAGTQEDDDEVESVSGRLQTQSNLVNRLIDRLRDREVYALAYKLRISDLPGEHSPNNPHVQKLIRLYRQPRKRLEFLQNVEILCELPAGSLIMYCPYDATMNAKVAKVNLYVEGEVRPFDDYETAHGGASLTRGALTAQVARFYELWSVQIYVERTCWGAMSQDIQGHLKAVLRAFFFQINHGYGLDVVRTQIDSSIAIVRAGRQAARGGSPDPKLDSLSDFVFPSGMRFSAPASPDGTRRSRT